MKPAAPPCPCPVMCCASRCATATWAYFFNVPMWARKAGCPVKNEPLGANHDAAVQRAETILLPAFDAWRSGGTDAVATVARAGTLDWVFAEYRSDQRFTRLDAKTKRNHEVGFRIVGGYLLKNGRRLGEMPVSAVTSAVIDPLYEKLSVVSETDADGNVVSRTPYHHGQPRDEVLPPRLERHGTTQPRKIAAGESVRPDGPAFIRPRDTDRDL